MKKILFIDMDGILADYISPEGTVCIDDFDRPGIFINKKPCWTIIEAIHKVFPKELFDYHILSAAPNKGAELEKIYWLDIYFKMPDDNHIHFVLYPTESKALYIEEYCWKNNIEKKMCTLLDDTQAHLKECERKGIRAIHPIHLLCLSEAQPESAINRIF